MPDWDKKCNTDTTIEDESLRNKKNASASQTRKVTLRSDMQITTVFFSKYKSWSKFPFFSPHDSPLLLDRSLVFQSQVQSRPIL